MGKNQNRLEPSRRPETPIDVELGDQPMTALVAFSLLAPLGIGLAMIALNAVLGSALTSHV
jgi:hypothetical protein